MGKLISLDRLKTYINPERVSDDAELVEFSTDDIVKFSSEPKIILNRDLVKRAVVLSVLFIVPKNTVTKDKSGKGHVVVRNRKVITEEYLMREDDTHKYLVGLGQYMQQEMLNYFVDYDFTSFNLHATINKTLEVITLEKLDKVRKDQYT